MAQRCEKKMKVFYTVTLRIFKKLFEGVDGCGGRVGPSERRLGCDKRPPDVPSPRTRRATTQIPRLCVGRHTVAAESCALRVRLRARACTLTFSFALATTAASARFPKASPRVLAISALGCPSLSVSRRCLANTSSLCSLSMRSRSGTSGSASGAASGTRPGTVPRVGVFATESMPAEVAEGGGTPHNRATPTQCKSKSQLFRSGFFAKMWKKNWGEESRTLLKAFQRPLREVVQRWGCCSVEKRARLAPSAEKNAAPDVRVD